MSKTDSSGASGASPPAETHLVCLFCVTAGQNGESLGSDEQPIVEMIFLLYDIPNNKVTTVQQHYVRPVADDISDTALSADCKQQTGLQEDDLRNAQPLEIVLEELERFLKAKEIHPHQGGRPFCLCTDGPLHLRLSLHPEAFRKNITLAPHLYRYYDLRKSFRQFYKVDKPIISTDGMLEFLGIDPDQSREFGIRHSQNMAKVISRLITDGHQFRTPEIIIDKLESGICCRADAIDDETVVKARGLPWQSSDQDIFNFFRGLNVARGGVAVCLSQQGRRNGEAMVRFESREHRMLALRKHKHHLGQRYIEVYRATGKDFLQVAAGSSREAQMFLSRQSQAGGQVIVRMRGLPYTAKAEQVIDFFKSGEPLVNVLDGEEGILFVHQADGRATGDAFVLFSSESEAASALTKHKQLMGTRYIELFKSTTAEVQQVLNRSMDPRNPAADTIRDLQAFKLAHLLHPMTGQMTAVQLPFQTLLRPAAANGAAPLAMTHHQLQQQQSILAGTGRKDCIRLRGFPSETTVNDIVAFLDRFSRDIVNQGVHLIYTSEGLPSGEAFIQMTSEEAAEGAMMSKNRKMVYVNNKRRSVEVMQCSSDSLSALLGGGVAPPSLTLPPINMQPVVSSLPSSAVNVNQWVGLPHLVQQQQSQLQAGLLGNGTTLPTIVPQMLPMSDVSTVGKPTNQDRNLIQYNGSGQILLTQQQQLLQPTSCMLPVVSAASPTFPAVACSMPQHQLLALSSQLASNSMLSAPSATFSAVPSNTGCVQPNYISVSGSSALPYTNGLPTNAAGTQYVALQPVFYWASPTPPLSPHSSYYVQPSPVSILVKGLPPSIQSSDILTFLKGLYEIQPDVQLQRGTDGRPTGDAIVTFATRAEADRAVTERNRKMLGNRLIELYAT